MRDSRHHRRRAIHAAVRYTEKDAVAPYRVFACRLAGFIEPSIKGLISMFATQEEAKVRSTPVEENRAEGPRDVHGAVQMSSRHGYEEAQKP